MEYTQKASLSQSGKVKSMITICIVATIALIGLALGVFAFLQGKILFGVLYLVAFCLGAGYVVIQINTSVPTYLAIDEGQVVLQNWENGVFPFNIAFKPAFFCDFVPAKTRIEHIDITKITKLMIGTKSFLIRNLSNTQFAEDMQFLIQTNPRCEKFLKKLDLIYIETIDHHVYYMSVDRFDPGDLTAILVEIEKRAPGLQIRCSNPDIRRRLLQGQ